MRISHAIHVAELTFLVADFSLWQVGGKASWMKYLSLFWLWEFEYCQNLLNRRSMCLTLIFSFLVCFLLHTLLQRCALAHSSHQMCSVISAMDFCHFCLFLHFRHLSLPQPNCAKQCSVDPKLCVQFTYTDTLCSLQCIFFSKLLHSNWLCVV